MFFGMARNPPKRIAINHDDYHAKYVGWTSDGRQFFLTTPFVPAAGDSAGREFLALYLFDKKGQLSEARIEDLGTRASRSEQEARRLHAELLASLGKVSYGRIKIAPFRVERFGVEFGLIVHPPEEEEDEWYAAVEPGNYMAFFPPWRSGEYDT